ncbi:MAG: alpha/beta fold hydrolase [Planctomycetota bacterium]
MPDQVVLIHGLAAKPWHMSFLGWQIKRSGFQVSYFRYPSWFKSIETHARNFCKFLERLIENNPDSKIHIVAHSMGAIVTRQALLFQNFEAIQRVVLLAGPNLGSPAATRLSRYVPFSKTVKQIADTPHSLANQLPGTIENVEVGCVEASYDFVIPKPSSHLAGEKDHVCVFGGHNGLLVRPAAGRQIVHFLNHGSFQPVPVQEMVG